MGRIRLTENDIHTIVENSVKRILREYGETWTPEQWAELSGRAAGSKKTGFGALTNHSYNKRKQRQQEP